MEVKVIGQMDNTIDHTFESANRVYDVGGVSPTINTCGGGGLQPKILEDKTIVAMRGRNPDNPSDRTIESPTEQRLEPNSQGLCNTLTSVKKDNLVLETDVSALRMVRTEEDKALRKQYESGEIKHAFNEHRVAEPRTDGVSNTLSTVQKDNMLLEIVRIKQATEKGYIECEVGGVADLSFPDSNTRRGRVQENGQVSPTLMAGEQDICRIEPQLVGGIGEKWGDKQYRQGNRVYDSESVAMAVTSQPLGNMGGNSYMYLTREPQYRIRKLTPLECWRLMNFKDEDFEKAAQVNSNTQLYKQAGNSIVKNVLVAILGQMIPGKEEVYKNI